MEQIREFADQRIRACHGDVCLQCGGLATGSDRTRDHVPSKALLLKPYPDNLPTVATCADCNAGFSKDEEYVAALLGVVHAGSTDPVKVADPAAKRILKRNPALRERIERGRVPPLGEEPLQWRVEWDRIAKVVVKNARGHLLFECAELMLGQPAYIGLQPLTAMSGAERDRFEEGLGDPVLPELGCRLFVRQGTSILFGYSWVDVQEDRYRFAVDIRGEMMGVRIVLSEYLAAEVIWRNP